MLALGLQGLGTQCFPTSMTSSGVTWFGKNGLYADVPCPLGCLDHPLGHPLPPQILPCVSRPQPCPSPNGLSHTQRCHRGEDTPTLKDLTLRETQLAPQEQVFGGQHQLGDIPPSISPRMSSALSSGHQGRVTPALRIQECPRPPPGAAPGTRALKEYGLGGDTLPVLLSPGGEGWGHSGEVARALAELGDTLG